MTDTPATPDEADAPSARPFADVLRELQGGRTHDDMSAEFRELVAAVKETGKAGKIVLTIEVKPVPKSDGLFVVADNYATKVPRHDRQTSFFYVTDDGNLTRDNPLQMQFESLRVVEGTKGDVKVIEKNGTDQ